MAGSTDSLHFLAAVERPLSAVFRGPGGAWEGHDYRVEVVAGRQGLDACDVVVDLRDLEAALDALLAPLRNAELGALGLAGPAALARHLAGHLAERIPPPARLVELRLTDGTGRSFTVRP